MKNHITVHAPKLARRAFLTTAGRGAVALGGIALASSSFARGLGAQSGVPQVGMPQSDPSQSGAQKSSASNVEMSADAYKPVRLPAKPGAQPGMSEAQLNEFEKGLACPCPCTQDVYTCRMTDLSCGISPAVHDDLNALVNGGYSADEIMKAMTDTYGDFILMEPRKKGFNLLAWFAPFTALGMGAVGIGFLLRTWRTNARAAERTRATIAPDINAATRDVSVRGSISGAAVPDATADELERLEAALRDGGR